MALTARQVVRVLIGDRVKAAVKETVGVGDGVNTTYQLDMFPIVTGSVVIYLTGVANSSTVAHDTGQLSLTAAAANGATIQADYRYAALADDEIDEIMSGIGTGKTLLVAANCAAALAADASRWFSYAMGDKEVNKDNVGKKLLALSESLENKYYRQRNDGNFNLTVATLQDLPTGTPYYDYDTGTTIDQEDD